MNDSALLQRFPRLGSSLPWIRLGQWPTPVTRLSRLSQALGREIWVKRDDLSGTRYGGNKVRKLELLLAHALHHRHQSIVTVGGIGSNHVVATGLYARQLGLPTRAVVVPQPITQQTHANLELCRSLEVKLLACPARPLVPLYLWRAMHGADRPYLIGPGGSSPLGVLGHVGAALELAHQIEAGELPEPHAIYVALGSGGTMAGLALGCALAGLCCEVRGVRVVERLLANRTTVRMQVRRARRLLGLERTPRPQMRVVHGYLGRCYGAVTPQATNAVNRAQDDGLLLETTYTGKAFAGLLDADPGHEPLLFWNTYNSRDTAGLLRPDPPELPETIAHWLAGTTLS